jgi:multiple sugar transport system permease protein
VKQRAALAMLLPAGAFFLLTFAVPMVIVGRLSLFETNYAGDIWVGLGNYVNAIKDKFFQKSFVNAMVMVVMICPLAVTLSYTIASFLLSFNEKVQAAGRFIIYIPGLASGIVMALLWKWMLHKAGLINLLTGLMGVPAIPWLTEVWPSRFALLLIVLMGGLGGNVIMFSASMHQMSKELRDAAMIDGCTDRQYKRHIVRPLMMPTILLLLLLSIVGMMQIWETVYILWENGGPESGIASPVYEIFMTAFQFGKQGYAASKGILLMVVIIVVLAIKQRVEKWVR